MLRASTTSPSSPRTAPSRAACCATAARHRSQGSSNSAASVSVRPPAAAGLRAIAADGREPGSADDPVAALHARHGREPGVRRAGGRLARHRRPAVRRAGRHARRTLRRQARAARRIDADFHGSHACSASRRSRGSSASRLWRSAAGTRRGCSAASRISPTSARPTSSAARSRRWRACSAAAR